MKTFYNPIIQNDSMTEWQNDTFSEASLKIPLICTSKELEDKLVAGTIFPAGAGAEIILWKRTI